MWSFTSFSILFGFGLFYQWLCQRGYQWNARDPGTLQVYYPLVNTNHLTRSTWSKSLRTHTIKWGIEAHRNRMDRSGRQELTWGRAVCSNSIRARPSFRRAGSGHMDHLSMRSLPMIGATDRFPEPIAVTPTNRQTRSRGSFRTLISIAEPTLDLGLRYEYYRP